MITIRKLTTNDIKSILKLEKEAGLKRPFYANYSRKGLEYIFDNTNKCGAWGAFDNSNLIGWSAYRSDWNKDSKQKGVYEMSGLVVDKAYRRKGIGLKLFNKRLKELLKKEDLKKIYATTYPLNKPLLILYLNNGFIIYDYRKDVYGKGGDRIYMKYEQKI